MDITIRQNSDGTTQIVSEGLEARTRTLKFIINFIVCNIIVAAIIFVIIIVIILHKFTTTIY